MGNRKTKKPTNSELEILQVMWELGPSTVRAVHHEINQRRNTGQTTILKLMQLMVEKGILTKDDSVRPQIYRTTRPRKQTQSQLVRDFLNRVFGGSPCSLVLQALSDRKTTAEERQKIRELLDSLEEQNDE